VSLDFFEQGRSRRGSLSAGDSSGSAGDASGSGATGAATLGPGPEFLRPPRGRRLQKALSIVREASEEGLLDDLSASQLAPLEEEAESEEGEEPECDDDDTSAAAATAAEGAAPQPECSDSSSSACGMLRASDLLAAAAAAGLVPRPGEGCHLTLDGPVGSGSALLLHLDPIPFAIRYGCLADADHLFWLHSYAVAGGLQRNVLTLEHIKQALVPAVPGAPPLCFVAEIGGYPAAALLLQPAEQAAEEQPARQAAGQQGRELQLLLAAVFPEMQERAQVLAALLSYTLQQLVADGATLTVQQGSLLVLPALHRLAPAAFDGLPASAVTGDASAPLLSIASSPFGAAADPAQLSWLLYRTQFAPGMSLDGFVLAVSAHMQEFSASPHTSITPLAAAPPDAAAVAAVVRAARRISQAWQDAGPAGAGAEEAAAEELVGEVTAVVTGFMDAAGFPTEGFAAHTPLMDAGLDSLDMLKLASLLSESLGMALPSTILFDYPSVEALCGYILAAQVPPAGAGGNSRRGSLVALSPGPGPLAQLQPGRVSGPGRRTTAGYAGRRTTSGYRRRTTTQDGGRRVTYQSMFAHGTLATVPLDGRRATVTPGGAIAPGGVPTLQVVLVEAAAQRLPSGACGHSAASFAVDMPAPVPHGRWDWEAHATSAAAAGSRAPARFGGFLQDIAAFDFSLFSIPASEAALLDPQQRLLLETAWEAASVPGASGASLLARAGRAGKAPAKAAAAAGVGVFVGASYAEWALLQQEHRLAPGAYTASGSGLSVLAGRVSYVFGWTGPATVTDTACSSSLVALSAAHQSLQLGVSRNALAGGLNLMMHPATTEMYNVAGMLAPDGRCKTLDAAADGYVRAEAALAMVLRAVDSLTAAATEGGGLHASMGTAVLLLGSAVNQDGRSSSLTAPNGPSQQALFRAAGASASLPASRVNLLSMHGTGTSLGDPIEVGAALAVLMHTRKATDGPLSLAASKAAVGHAEAAAGLVGFASAVLCTEGRALPQMLHLGTVNPYVQQCIATACKPSPSSPEAPPSVSAPRAPAALPAAAQHGRLTAGISAFAFQGTNAHAVLEVLDMGSCLSVLNRSPLLSTGSSMPVWQRASYWLAPPASQLLTACLGRAAGVTVVLQGHLQAPAVAALVRAAGASGGWAVAAEAACTAVAILAAAGDGKQQLAPGLAHAAIASAAGERLAAGAQLQAAVDARRGSVAVTVDGGQQPLLAASIVASAELPAPALTQCRAHRSVLLARLLQPAASEAAAATAVIAASAAQHAQNMHGLFVQPALLQAGTQLQQLSTADAGCEQAAEPVAFICLLPADRQPVANSSSGHGKALVSRRTMWYGSACQRTLRLCSGSGCSLQLSGVQWRHAARHPADASAAAATGMAADVGCSYVASWQAVKPQQSAYSASPHRQAGALIALSQQLPGRYGCSREQRRAAWLAGSRRGGLQAGEAACFRSMQALQTAAATGARALSLTTLASAEATTPAPLSSGSAASAASSAALFAMLRCAASELPDVACSAGSVDAATAGSSLADAAPWDAAYGCHGQQQSASQLLAARLLPTAEPQQPPQPAAAVQQQQWAVSGGTGSLGLLVSTWLQLRQAGGLLLLGRSGRLADAAPSELLAAGGVLTACMCDAGMLEDAAAALCCSASADGPLTGLVHAGGILRDAALQQQTAATIRAVHAPKTAGLARLLGAAGNAAPLQQALLFSSIAAVTGPAGSSNYAAANAALDAAAGQLQLQGEQGVVCKWAVGGKGTSPHLLAPPASALLSDALSLCLRSLQA
jgi:3-oxoacyl-(acyl-carrier-protein) synthase